MKRALLASLAALLLAGGAEARALFVRGIAAPGTPAGMANQSTGIERLTEVVAGMASRMDGDYDIRDITDFTPGATEALRRGVFYPGGIGTSDSTEYGLIVLIGDNMASGAPTWTVGSTSAQAGSGGYATLRCGTANAFIGLHPGMTVTGTPITNSAIIVGVDSLYRRMTVAGTVAYSANFTLTWRHNLRTDSLTRAVSYPRVPILRFQQYMATGAFQRSATCSTGVEGAIAYSTHHDSTLNAYEVGNAGVTRKLRNGVVASGTRDPRGWRPMLGVHTTRKNEAGHANGNYDYRDPDCGNPQADPANPDTVALHAIMNFGADGTPIGGDAAPNIYCVPSTASGTNLIDPGIVLGALAWADSLSGGALFGESKRLPVQAGIHIDDGWKRGDSRFNAGGAYGGISMNDTTAFVGSIDSLAALGVKFVVGYEADSLDSVTLSEDVAKYTSASITGANLALSGIEVTNPGFIGYHLLGLTNVYITAIEDNQLYTLNRAPGDAALDSVKIALLGNGRYYDQRWWARAPLARYTPHCHAGLVSGTNRVQNNATKFLRPLDIWGLSRTRYAFGSVDSLLAYGEIDYVNEAPDSGATYWLNKRAVAMGDSVFGASRVDGVVMPPGDDWTNSQQSRTDALTVDSIAVAALMSGSTDIRSNTGLALGIAPGGSTSNYGYYVHPHQFRVRGSGATGVPSWTPARFYGRSCWVKACKGYPSLASVASWSGNRANDGGEKFLLGLLTGHTTLGGQPDYPVSILALHCGDLGSSGLSGEATRPQFYTIKYVKAAFDFANNHARQTMAEFVYPEDIRP